MSRSVSRHKENQAGNVSESEPLTLDDSRVSAARLLNVEIQQDDG